MDDNKIKLAQKDIDDALSTVEAMEKCINESTLTNEEIKKKFMTLSEKVQQIEDILKTEGII
ncbi:hypothetical protein [Desnuesiella massiliensis]|uniref:hypothetical protein n=1 Tax=Desnuesiella massiliensis TaxID=1650662 RepID=UPI0006E405B5|nr:hypothetical protein [Desnuesiella massiliensis]